MTPVHEAIVVVVVNVVVVVVVVVDVVKVACEVCNSAGHPTTVMPGKTSTHTKPALLVRTSNLSSGYQWDKREMLTVCSELSEAKICSTKHNYRLEIKAISWALIGLIDNQVKDIQYSPFQ